MDFKFDKRATHFGMQPFASLATAGGFATARALDGRLGVRNGREVLLSRLAREQVQELPRGAARVGFLLWHLLARPAPGYSVSCEKLGAARPDDSFSSACRLKHSRKGIKHL